MSKSRAPGIARRHFLVAAAAGALSVSGGTAASARPGPGRRTNYHSNPGTSRCWW